MKIAYLSTFYPFRGGIAQFNARLLKALSRYAEVTAFTFKRQYPSLLFPGKSQYVQEGDNPEKVNSIPLLDTINPFSYFKTAKIIRKYNPDITITKYWMPFFAPSLGYVLWKLKQTSFNVSILDNVEPHENFPFSRTLTKFFLTQNHLLIVMSEAVEKDLLKIFPEARYIRLQHPLYDNFGNKVGKKEARIQLGLPLDKKILLFFGFIREYKGLDILLESLSLLPNEYHLVVAGEPYTNFEKYSKIIQSNNLSERICLFVRFIAEQEVPLFFSSADVCVLPYKSATQSGIVGIAYNFDLPVIASSAGGLAEMITPFGSGLVVEKCTPQNLANAIVRFFSMDRENFISGINKYKAIANWDYFAKKIIDEYNFFVSSKTRSNFA